jgi:hypothetical protein
MTYENRSASRWATTRQTDELHSVVYTVPIGNAFLTIGILV